MDPYGPTAIFHPPLNHTPRHSRRSWRPSRFRRRLRSARCSWSAAVPPSRLSRDARPPATAAWSGWNRPGTVAPGGEAKKGCEFWEELGEYWNLKKQLGFRYYFWQLEFTQIARSLDHTSCRATLCQMWLRGRVKHSKKPYGGNKEEQIVSIFFVFLCSIVAGEKMAGSVIEHSYMGSKISNGSRILSLFFFYNSLWSRKVSKWGLLYETSGLLPLRPVPTIEPWGCERCCQC